MTSRKLPGKQFLNAIRQQVIEERMKFGSDFMQSLKKSSNDIEKVAQELSHKGWQDEKVNAL